jgi:hypothetical protein
LLLGNNHSKHHAISKQGCKNGGHISDQIATHFPSLPLPSRLSILA